MSIFPKIEKITRDLTTSHFLLMFGYKLFALYFPLFLVARGLSLPEVGYTYLLIYLPIALFAPIAGFLNHKINPAVLASLGILGYALYAAGMILIKAPALFYFWQVLLGISAALFFVSARAILMSSPLENYDRSFGWFYTAPFYAEALAPVVGALFIWKFDFIGVFIFSLVIQIFTAIFCFTQLKRGAIRPLNKFFNFQKFQENYQKVFQKIKGPTILPPILISFSVLLVAGFYRAFFVLFLKDSLLWSQNLILIFASIFSFLFLPLSLLSIKYLGRLRSEKNIFQGGLITGFSLILFGVLVPALNFFSILLINLGRSIGVLICSSGRSGLISQKLKENPEEAGAIDTIFSPLGAALGALISGALIGFLGYSPLFILGGVFIVVVSLIVKKFAKS
jgi:MFS family permease